MSSASAGGNSQGRISKEALKAKFYAIEGVVAVVLLLFFARPESWLHRQYGSDLRWELSVAAEDIQSLNWEETKQTVSWLRVDLGQELEGRVLFEELCDLGLVMAYGGVDLGNVYVVVGGEDDGEGGEVDVFMWDEDKQQWLINEELRGVGKVGEVMVYFPRG